jgi:hypothetical protein
LQIEPVIPSWGAEGFDPYNVGGIASLRVVKVHTYELKVFNFSYFNTFYSIFNF